MEASLSNKRVFIVEDDQANAAIIQMLLEQSHCRVFRGRWGGQDTLDLLKRYSPIEATGNAPVTFVLNPDGFDAAQRRHRI